jgi:hypothetical protein
MLLLPAVNQMIDITTTRTVAGLTHPLEIIFVMLCVLALACSLLAGYGMVKVQSGVTSLGPDVACRAGQKES